MNAAAHRPDPRRRVLIVEDEAAICDLMADALRLADFEPECVSTDKAARDRLRRKGFAAVILDINLGAGETGFDVARFARMQSPGVAVLYVTGQASESSFRAFGVPGSRFMAKPFLPDELVRGLHVLLGANDS